MRRSWLVLFGCLVFSPALSAAPVPKATPKATPQAAAHATPQHAAPQAANDSPYRMDDGHLLAPLRKVGETKIASIARVNVADIGILVGIDSTELVQAGSGLHMVNQFDAAHPTAPEKVALIRNANHKIDGAEVTRYRAAAGDADGNVYVHYTVRNGQGGRNPHIRRIKPDNSLGFDNTVLMEEKAGIAPDGAGGVYVVTHKTVDTDNDFYTDSTTHTAIRYDSAGAVLWQVAEPPALKPYADSYYWSSAARGGQGVYAGYGIGAANTNDQTPVLLHRKASDGSVVYKRVGLKGPNPTVTTGALGTTPLIGRVDAIWPQSDGSVIASVFRPSTDKNIVRVDAAGTQTAAFKCAGYEPRLLRHNDGVLCVLLPADGTLSVARYGVSGGNLKPLANFKTEAITGWDFNTLDVTGDGQYLATATTSSGFAGVALFSASGALLFHDLLTDRPGSFTHLRVHGRDWIAMHKGADIDARTSVWRGTIAPGT